MKAIEKSDSCGMIRRFFSKISCKSFLIIAALWSLLFLTADLAGFREYTAIISGTDVLTENQKFCGIAYIILYSGFVLAVPILIIASVLVEICLRIKYINRQD